MAKKGGIDLAKIHEEAKSRFESAYAVRREQALQSMQDRRFLVVAGGQYEGQFGEQYEDRAKPEVNKTRMGLRRIESEYRANPITADFVAKDGGGNDQLATALDGVFRSDEQDFGAEEAYDNCFAEAVAGGFGAYRYRAVSEFDVDADEYGDDDAGPQRIACEWIPDADVSVVFDPCAKRQDKSDAKWCGVVWSYSPEDYEEEFGDDPSSWPTDVNTAMFDWVEPERVFVLEYFRKEEETETLFVYEDVFGNKERHPQGAFESDPNLALFLEATGKRRVGEITREKSVVRKYLLSGNSVLDHELTPEERRIPGNVIPIVPQYGERYIVNGIERFNGIVRTLKDSQRIYNMLVGLLCELATTGLREVPYVAAEQLPQGYRDAWNDPNSLKSYLPLEPIRNPDGSIAVAGPLGSSKAPEVPPALAALIQVVGADIKELMGNQEAGEELQSNISGKVVELVQSKLDMQSFIYISNARKARKRGAEVWLAMAKELYVEPGRRLQTVGREGELGFVEIGKAIQGKNGAVGREFDLSRSRFGVYADVGPASSSKKAATVRNIMAAMQVAQSDPETAMILLSTAIMNMEGEGIEELRPYFRKKMLRMGVVQPTKEEEAELKAEMENAKPNPQEEYFRAAAASEAAKAQKAEADTYKALAQTEETKAKTAQIIAGIDRDDRSQALDAIEAFTKADTARPQNMGERNAI